MKFYQIIGIQGRILMILSFFISTTIPWLIHFDEIEYLWPIVYSIVIPLFTGMLLYFSTRKHHGRFKAKDGYIIVSLTWMVMGLVGSLPFLFTGTIPGFFDAFFESVSGFTTTGSSILTDIESLPKSILYWRSLTHWIGGMGIIVLVIAILPALKIAGYQLLPLETSGITSEKFKPRTADIAKRLWGIYFLLTVLLVALLMLGGVNFYESLCHAFGTVATGGFSTKNSSIANYSPYVQYVITLFMIISGINFSLHYFFLKGRFNIIFKNSELRTFISIILITGFSIMLILIFTEEISMEKALRDSFFQVASIITATGFATTDYLQWEEYAWLLILGLMFIGACVGSTGGGIKVIRHVVAFKAIYRSFNQLLHPNAIKSIRVNGSIIGEDKIGSVIVFIFVYLMIVFAGTIFMLFTGLDMQSAVGSVLATLGGIGPGIGSVGPAGNFAHISDIGKIFLSLIMITGRLEIFTFVILFTRDFWR